jgi:hypothetical protein
LKKRVFIVASFLILIIFLGCNSSTQKTENYETKLQPPADNKIYFGAFPDFGGSEDNVTSKRLNDFEKLIEKKIAWAYFSQNWFNGIIYPKEAIATIHQQGAIPFVRLMPRSNEEQFVKEEKFTLDNIIKGDFDKELRAWAKDAKEDNIPLLIDFAVEMNGDWFSWSGYFNGADKKDGYGDPNYYDGPERYRDAYRHIIDIFNQERVTHVTWFFHLDIHSTPNEEWNQPKYYYPGDDYIDWIVTSIYGALSPKEEYWEGFDEILQSRYQSILDVSPNKPFALLEFGVTDNHHLGSKPIWIEGAFETILAKRYIDFDAISYWHESWEEEDNVFATIRVDSSAESLEVFKNYAKKSIFIHTLTLEEPKVDKP